MPRIVIDLDGVFAVSQVTIDGERLARSAWRQGDGQIVIDRPIGAGARADIGIAYAGRPRVAKRAPWDDGFVWSEAAGRPWFATTAQGKGCDLWWPCLDFPLGEPGGVTLHITVPRGLSAPANGVLTGIDRLPDGRSTWHWRSGPVNPYAIALSVGPYREITDSHHDHHDLSVSSLHVHLDRDTCLEVSVLKGPGGDIRHFAEHVIAERSVRHGQLVVIPETAKG